MKNEDQEVILNNWKLIYFTRVHSNWSKGRSFIYVHNPITIISSDTAPERGFNIYWVIPGN